MMNVVLVYTNALGVVVVVVETLEGTTKILQLGQSRGIDVGGIARRGGKRRHRAVRADRGGGDDGGFQR